MRSDAYVIQGIAQDKLFLLSQGMLSNENVTRVSSRKYHRDFSPLSSPPRFLYVSFSLCLSFERIPESWNNAKVGLARLDSGEARNFHHLARTCSSSPFFDSRSSVPSPLGRKFNPAAFNPRNFLISDIYTRLFDMEKFESLHVSREQSATGYPVLRKEGIEEFVS